ncbi:sulfate transporter family protein [Brucella endophytica]|nr:sulfate transporter family protein [Brucella endophytica]
MIFDAASAALRHLPTPAFRSLLWKSLGATFVILMLLWIALRQIFVHLAWPYLGQMLPGLPEWAGWLGTVGAIFASLGLALGLALLIAPITALIAGLFLDDAAEIIERTDYPADAPGQALPLMQSLVLSLKFLGVVIVGNIFALFLLLVPGVNLIAFFIVNGYLLGREYFEFAAMRFRTPDEAKALRSKYAVTVFLAGLIIAAFLAIPIVNLLTPLFAAAMMVHLYKAVSRREQAPAASMIRG